MSWHRKLLKVVNGIDHPSDIVYTSPNDNTITRGLGRMDITGRELLRYNQVRDEEYTYVPHGLERMKLSGTEFSIYFLLLIRIDKNDRVEVSYNELAEKANISRRTAIRALAGLEEHGLVKRVKQSAEDGSLLKNAYEIYRPIETE